MNLENQNKNNNEQFLKEARAVANRLFSSEDGKKYGRQMLRACHYFEQLGSNMNERDIIRISYLRDFVTAFLVNLVDADVFLDLIDKRKDNNDR